MKILKQMLAVGAAAVVLGLGTGNVAAQQGGPGGRGNFDPEQFRQRMMERYKERLEVTNEDEWKLIGERIEKVTNAQRDARMGGFGGFGGGRGGRRGGAPGGDAAQAPAPAPAPDAANAAGRNRGGFGGEPSPEADALQKAIDAKASPEELKTKLAKLRDSQKDKDAKLAKAQEDLRAVLTVRQEANAVLLGLLK